MICPHCNTGVNITFRETQLPHYANKAGGLRAWQIRQGQCPECKESVLYLVPGRFATPQHPFQAEQERMIEPASGSRPCPPEVPAALAKDFLEASAVISISPQASAALSRRSLQHILKDFAGATKKDLALQIDEVIAANNLPSSLAEQLDAVRNIGNFAAHPLKSTSTGEIIPVESHEAEWNLDVLEELFDHFFVKPAKAKARKDEFNKKLAAVGKPLLP